MMRVLMLKKIHVQSFPGLTYKNTPNLSDSDCFHTYGWFAPLLQFPYSNPCHQAHGLRAGEFVAFRLVGVAPRL